MNDKISTPSPEYTISLLEEMQESAVIQLEGWSSTLEMAIGELRNYSLLTEKLLDTLEKIHPSLHYALDWAEVNQVLHDAGRYKITKKNPK